MDPQLSEDLLQAKQKYFVVQNRVNLLLVREYKLKKEKKEYSQQLQEINQLIRGMESGKVSQLNNPNRAVLSQDTFLRDLIRKNSLRIKDLERKEGQEIIQCIQAGNKIHENFRKMLNGELEKKTRQTLSSLKGRVEELRKKSKQLMKQIQTLEEAQRGYIDELSMQNESLRDEDLRVRRLKQEIRMKKESRG